MLRHECHGNWETMLSVFMLFNLCVCVLNKQHSHKLLLLSCSTSKQLYMMSGLAKSSTLLVFLPKKSSWVVFCHNHEPRGYGQVWTKTPRTASPNVLSVTASQWNKLKSQWSVMRYQPDHGRRLQYTCLSWMEETTWSLLITSLASLKLIV